MKLINNSLAHVNFIYLLENYVLKIEFYLCGRGSDMGVERGIRLEGMAETQISKALEDLVKVGASLKS
ncbi:NADH dehydrogenase [Artemisia annua]|uniref:NADH dehydrogenase n=1 Tax=Artemisia annua TaxID=35608 RepID=A0A2U1M8T7_ARTAN|nr:NADH dehydrogenase [Artemisia annua]